MNETANYKISRDFKLKLENELEEKNNEVEIETKHMSDAKEQGDLSENYDYQSSKDKINKYNSRINEIKEILGKSNVVPVSYYKYENLKTHEIWRVTLVDDIESDLFTEEDVIAISSNSGIAQQINGLKTGDEVDIRDLRKGENSPVLYRVRILDFIPDYSKYDK